MTEKTNPFAWSRGFEPPPFYVKMAEMAAKIEELEAENARLKDALADTSRR